MDENYSQRDKVHMYNIYNKSVLPDKRQNSHWRYCFDFWEKREGECKPGNAGDGAGQYIRMLRIPKNDYAPTRCYDAGGTSPSMQPSAYFRMAPLKKTPQRNQSKFRDAPCR